MRPGPSCSTRAAAEPISAAAPRAHRDPAFLAAKQGRWGEPHVAPLNALADVVATATSGDVPRVDPASGGVAARVLLLLEAPSGAAAYRSGMVSADNDDATAANLWRAYEASGLPRSASVVWNAVPWYVGVPGRLVTPRAADVREGRVWLSRFLDLLPDLRVVVALGRIAQHAVAPPALEARGLTVLVAPHPSQRVYNRPGQDARTQVHEALRVAAAYVCEQDRADDA